MLSALTLGLATNLTSDLLKAGSRRLRDRVQGEPQERALRRVYTAAFEALLDQIGDGLSEGEVETLARRAFQPFLNQAGVAAALLDVALIQREPDPAWLYAQFETARDADVLHNIRFDEQTFERGMLEFQRTLTQEVLQDAAKPESSLFNLETVAALQELLRRTEALLAQPHPSAPAPQRATFPLHLGIPSTRPHFVGRDELMDELVAWLSAGQATALSAEGLPGVGKTTLAVHLAHDRRIREHFVDGILWASLGPEGDPLRAMGPWLEALDLDPRTLPDLRARSRALRNGLAERKLLIVWDDLWDSPGEPVDVDALRCGGPGCAYLLTTRNTRLARDFAGAAGSIAVAVLSDEEAYALLHDLTPAACDADPDAAFALATLAGGLPLTVELLGGYLANAGDNELFADLSQAAMAELRDPRRRLDLARRRLEGVDGRQETLRQTIHFSLDALRRAGRDEAVTAFHALSAFAPKPATFTRDAAEQVAECDGRALQTLVQRNLLERDGHELTLHQTLHDVSSEYLTASAITRFLDYYLELVKQNHEDVALLDSVFIQIQRALVFSNSDARLAYLWVLQTYYERRALWNKMIDWIGGSIAEKAHNLMKTEGERNKVHSSLLYKLAWCYSCLGRKHAAMEHYQEALRISDIADDLESKGAILNDIGLLHDQIGDSHTALTYLEQALFIHRKNRNEEQEAVVIHNIGLALAHLGRKTEALEKYEQAIVLRRKVVDEHGEASTLNNMARVYSDLDDEAKAIELYNQSLTIAERIGDRVTEASALHNIGHSYEKIDQRHLALGYHIQALDILHEAGATWEESTVNASIGRIYAYFHDFEMAERHLEAAVDAAYKLEHVHRHEFLNWLVQSRSLSWIMPSNKYIPKNENSDRNHQQETPHENY